MPECGCWLWLTCIDEHGYPRLKVSGRNVRAHRLSLELKLGKRLSRRHQACHTCDERSCVNPDHLFAGTNLANVRDKVSKGRQARVPNGGVRLTLADARAIRDVGRGVVHGPRETQRAIARRLGISERQVERICKGERWKEPAMPALEAAE